MNHADAATRIRWARAILGSKWNRASVESAVHAMLYHEGRAAALKAKHKRPERPTNKIEKRAVGRVAAELARLNAALRKSDLPSVVSKLLPVDLLREREIGLYEMAGISLKKPKQFSNQKKKLPGRSNLRWQAAQYASLTLQELGMYRATTRGKTLHKLAAAYYGNQDADLFDYICFYRELNHLDAGED
jgi:hypothetical protein